MCHPHQGGLIKSSTEAEMEFLPLLPMTPCGFLCHCACHSTQAMYVIYEFLIATIEKRNRQIDFNNIFCLLPYVQYIAILTWNQCTNYY